VLWECWDLIDPYEQVICNGADIIHTFAGDDYIDVNDTLGDDYVDAGEGNDSCKGDEDDPGSGTFGTDVFVNCEYEDYR